MRRALTHNIRRRQSAPAEMARIAKITPRQTRNIGARKNRPSRSVGSKSDISDVRGVKLTAPEPSMRLDDSRKDQTISLVLHAMILLAFSVMASFGLAFFFMIGLRWGFVVGVLIYVILLAACWNADEDEEVPLSEDTQTSPTSGVHRVDELGRSQNRTKPSAVEITQRLQPRILG